MEERGGGEENKINPWLKSMLDQVKNDPQDVARERKGWEAGKNEWIAGRDDMRKKAAENEDQKEERRFARESLSSFITCVNRGVVGADE
jgi:hypothetical protein